MFHAKSPSAKGVQPSLSDDESCAFGVCCPKTREIVDAASVFETAAEHNTSLHRFDAVQDDEDNLDLVAAEAAIAAPGPAPTVPPKRTGQEQQTQATETPRSEHVSSDEEEPPAPEELEEPGVLRAVFRPPGGEEAVVRFRRRPIGFTLLADTMPPTARVVSGHAQELGVRSGALEKLGDVAFGSDTGFKEAATCRRLASELPPEQAADLLPVGNGLEVVFSQRRALRPVQVVFHCRPLGIDFDRNVLPLTVLTAYGAAARLGVEPGWTVARFGGAELGMADCAADFNEAIKIVKSLIAKLPQRESIQPETHSCVVH